MAAVTGGTRAAFEEQSRKEAVRVGLELDLRRPWWSRGVAWR
jgi:hypothetical protein